MKRFVVRFLHEDGALIFQHTVYAEDEISAMGVAYEDYKNISNYEFIPVAPITQVEMI